MVAMLTSNLTIIKLKLDVFFTQSLPGGSGRLVKNVFITVLFKTLLRPEASLL